MQKYPFGDINGSFSGAQVLKKTCIGAFVVSYQVGGCLS